jgi:arylsulfatase A-like enzyme
MHLRTRSLKISLPLLVAALAACAGPAERALVRFTELEAEVAPGEPVVLAQDVTVGTEPLDLPLDLAAVHTGKLSLAGQGDAPLLTVAWKLASERRFSRFRALTVPLAADGEPHRYEVDLSNEPYWTGTLDTLRLSVPEGRAELTELTAQPQGAARRTFALGGLSLSALPGLRRLELRLPEDAPRRAVFEVRLGLAPQFDRPGVTARFRVWSGEGESREIWLEEEVAGGGEPRWRPVRRQVRVAPGGRVVLEVEARRGGAELPEGAAVWGAPMLVARGRAARGPHLLVVLVDTLRADVVGAYGDTDGLTPHLDRLAAGSVRLDELLAPSSWTLPSVASLVTGLPPQIHDTGRPLGEGFAPTALGPAPLTLAGVLAARGFYTAAVYNNIFLGPSFGVDRGFDEYAWIEQEDDVLVDRAVELLGRLPADRRLFLLLHLFGPHNPYAPPGDGCAVAERLAPADPGGVGCAADRRPGTPVPPEESWPRIEALYRAEVAYTDRQLGRLFAALDDTGLADETVVLVVSDHGEDFWGRLPQMRRRGYEDADHGHALYQELVRVVGMVRAPGLAPGVVKEPVEMADLFPTLLGLLGVAPPPGAEPGAPESLLPGLDLGPGLRGEASPPRRTLISDFLLYGEPRWSVRRGPWKLVVPRAPELAPELYNLEDDPGELHDLAAERPDRVAAMREGGEAELARREELRRRLGGGRDALHPAYLQWNHITKLRALGYLK